MQCSAEDSKSVTDTDESGTNESEDDSDRNFIIHDEASDSEDAYLAQDEPSEDDTSSVDLDSNYDSADTWEDADELRVMFAALMGSDEGGQAEGDDSSIQISGDEEEILRSATGIA